METLEIVIDRKYKKPTYTIGDITIDGVWFCNSLEDVDRGLTQFMSLDEIKRLKIPGETAIATGRFEIVIDEFSPKFSKYPFYMEVCGGYLPRFKNVPGFLGVLFHVMDGENGAKLSLGCVGIGRNKIKGGLLEGKEYFRKFYKILKDAKQAGKKIYCTIK